MVATAMITMDTVCGWSFLEAAVVQAEAAAGVEAAGLPEAAMAPRPGVLKTEWLSLVSLLCGLMRRVGNHCKVFFA